LPTAGVPFLAHLLARAAASGVTHVVLATCYKASMFSEVFGDGSAFGLSISYVTEDEPLDTGGGIRNAARSLRGVGSARGARGAEPVVVMNCDILTGHDLGAQLDLHLKTDAAVTLHLVEVPDPSRFGCVPTDAAGHVTAFLEKTPNPVTNWINAGSYVFRRDVIDTIPEGRRVSVERETFPGLIEAGETVMGYHESAYWLDVGTPQAFVRGSCDLVLGELPAPAIAGLRGASLGGSRLVLAGAVVAEGATVDGGTTVGAGASVAAGALVSGSVLFDEAVVEAGAIVSGSILGRGAVVEAGAVVRDGSVIGDGAVIGAGNELDRGIRIWPGARLAPTSVRFSSDV
jgi:mannose-1-phosphate guanylyltransferase